MFLGLRVLKYIIPVLLVQYTHCEKEDRWNLNLMKYYFKVRVGLLSTL